jgi:hypothetical protein
MKHVQLLFFDKNTTRLIKYLVNPYLIGVSNRATIEWE